MAIDFQVRGKNKAAPFRLKVHRGEGMCLLAMDWRKGKPPQDFVGFAIEYREPGGDRFYALKNRLGFLGPDGKVDWRQLSTRQSPIQMFRWVHFPRNAEMEGRFTYRVTPVFMNAKDELSYGEVQEVALPLARETHPGKLNVSFTRGFVSSQAFVDHFGGVEAVPQLLPPNADSGLTFKPTHKEAERAYAWMGFEARHAVLEVLDEALADPKAQVEVVAYELNEPGVLARLEGLGPRLRIILDDSGHKDEDKSAESQAEKRLVASAGRANVLRQDMKKLQHNKTIVVDGPKVKAAVCGSTNFSWRGFFVQNNAALVVRGAKAIAPFRAAFKAYWENEAGFAKTPAAEWADLGLRGVDAKVTFSPHSKANSALQGIADELRRTKSSLFYSMAFLYQTPGAVLEAIKEVTANPKVFVYGVSDKSIGELELQKPDGNVAPVYPEELGKGVPPPFSQEPSGGAGIRLHHKFAVLDFDRPAARVYVGSYNFSKGADQSNGENLLFVRDRRVAVAFAIEALRIFDHYSFRVKRQKAESGQGGPLALRKPPRKPGEKPWWDSYYRDPRKVRDRELFA
jgi:phosphatidylserine/phosphatidylglycerophosphate/cardiolipin synthase-like enzyme